jgi:hypothetical protein
MISKYTIEQEFEYEFEVVSDVVAEEANTEA